MTNSIMKKMKKIISFCLFGNNPLYLKGAVENAIFAKEVFPGWICRFYCHPNIPANLIKILRTMEAEVIIVKKGTKDHLVSPMLWRSWPLRDRDVSYFIARDCDSRLSFKEAEAVKKWILSKKNFCLMYDNPAHTSLVMGGMWGAKGGLIRNIDSKIIYYFRKNRRVGGLNDQPFLCSLWPIIKKSYIAFGNNTILKKKYPDLRFQQYPKHKGFKHPGQRFIGQTISVKGAKPKIRRL